MLIRKLKWNLSSEVKPFVGSLHLTARTRLNGKPRHRLAATLNVTRTSVSFACDHVRSFF
jgi:hypothetical protein